MGCFERNKQVNRGEGKGRRVKQSAQAEEKMRQED